MQRQSKSVIPGFNISLGITLIYLSIIVLLPLVGLFIKSASGTWEQVWQAISNARVIHAFQVSLLTSLGAALVNGIIGLLLAWVLVRYSFPGRKLLDAMIDIPFALPTAVAGISLTAIYDQNGLIGQFFAPLGWKIAYTPIGIAIALLFIGVPFVVRTVQPVLEDLDREVEEAAMTLGASRIRIFWQVILPALMPAWLTGISLAFARGLGEYGSVVFIAGNLPMKTEIVPLMIISKLDQYDYIGAAAIATLMLLISFVMLLVINTLQWLSRRRVQNT